MENRTIFLQNSELHALTGPLLRAASMAEKKRSLWKRILGHFREPPFREILEDSTDALLQKPVAMNCPQCGEMVPFADRCINCGSPRHRPIDERI